MQVIWQNGKAAQTVRFFRILLRMLYTEIFFCVCVCFLYVLRSLTSIGYKINLFWRDNIFPYQSYLSPSSSTHASIIFTGAHTDAYTRGNTPTKRAQAYIYTHTSSRQRRYTNIHLWVRARTITRGHTPASKHTQIYTLSLYIYISHSCIRSCAHGDGH